VGVRLQDLDGGVEHAAHQLARRPAVDQCQHLPPASSMKSGCSLESV
jgi:hypothetical protein